MQCDPRLALVEWLEFKPLSEKTIFETLRHMCLHINYHVCMHTHAQATNKNTPKDGEC